jgi:SAM-dependent methyltransferase
MPLHDVSDFSYVDLGSGKGRSLFVAAELPFRQVTGVEFSRPLHQQACANIRSFRRCNRGCSNITSLHMNAKNFAFPETRLVLYMFNPFGSATMQRVLSNLEMSLQRNPRHVIVLLLWPRCSDQVAAVHGMHLRLETPQYQIFEAFAPQPSIAAASQQVLAAG